MGNVMRNRHCSGRCEDTSFKNVLHRQALLSLVNVSNSNCPVFGYLACYPTPSSGFGVSDNTQYISDIPGYLVLGNIEFTTTIDEDGSYLLECPKLSVFSTGITRAEAVENLKENIASLHQELNDGTKLSLQWERIRDILNSVIIPEC